MTIGTRHASPRQLADAARGAALLGALQPFCRSGGTVVDRGHVLAIECGEGVAGLIARAGALRQWGRRRWAKR
ncbi:UDP-2,3-diacylglucosamine diphosphatase LpxI, partial [Microbacteriaceae bacterium K1510]|nr:UDP-2,3-diacylglucosamine diphosphatase LpxI [Microbacteriaceae bacterium K1510]